MAFAKGSPLPKPRTYVPLFKKCDSCKFCIRRDNSWENPTTCAWGMNPKAEYDWYEEPQYMHFAEKCPKYSFGPALLIQQNQKSFNKSQQYVLDLERTTKLISMG
jgi:hypothetical protein